MDNNELKLKAAEIAGKLTEITFTKTTMHGSTENVINTFSKYYETVLEKLNK